MNSIIVFLIITIIIIVIMQTLDVFLKNMVRIRILARGNFVECCNRRVRLTDVRQKIKCFHYQKLLNHA